MLKRVAFLMVFATSALTACIFDSGGDYVGGGRRDVGAKLQQEDPNAGEDSGSGSSSGGQDSGGNPLADGGGGGG